MRRTRVALLGRRPKGLARGKCSLRGGQFSAPRTLSFSARHDRGKHDDGTCSAHAQRRCSRCVVMELGSIGYGCDVQRTRRRRRRSSRRRSRAPRRQEAHAEYTCACGCKRLATQASRAQAQACAMHLRVERTSTMSTPHVLPTRLCCLACLGPCVSRDKPS